MGCPHCQALALAAGLLIGVLTTAHAWTPLPRWLCLALLVVVITGCSSNRRSLALAVNGERSLHFVVIGFGVVSVPKTEANVAVTATKVQGLGVTVTDAPGLKVGLGYSSATTVSVPDEAEDVRVEVYQEFGGPVVVDATSARLGKHQKSEDSERETP